MKLILLVLLVSSLFSSKPKLFLLNNYSDDINISSWHMSEKLDGVRAYWDGKKLISRNGKLFNAPAFFISNFPKHELDGELWTKRADFSNISSIVNTKKSKKMWNNLTYNIFEVPNAKGNLLKRLNSIDNKSKYIKIIKQIKIKDEKHLQEFLKSVENKSGEGVVIRDSSLLYYIGRNNNSLKLKSYIDDECEVISHNKGKGKYIDKLGSLSCKMGNNIIIKIGTGFNAKERVNPPKIGDIITFKYYGLTSKGNPRFPVFLRVRK